MKQNTALTALDILKSGKNVFITGSAGTGKTYLLNLYTQYLKERRVYPTIVAPTGIAASHLGGQTIHSFFSLGIRESIDEGYVDFLLDKKYLKTRFSKLKLLIIDEVSMVSPELFSSMDLILRGFKGTDTPFGGVLWRLFSVATHLQSTKGQTLCMAVQSVESTSVADLLLAREI